MEDTYDVVGFGALNLDRLYRVERLAKPGEHIPITEVSEAPGGSAANTIAALASFGARTGFVGAVGKDAEGDLLLQDFINKGVDTRGISVLDERTGIIIGFIDGAGERTLYPYPGANSSLHEKDIDPDYPAKASILHLTSFVGVKQFELQKKIINDLSDVKISLGLGSLYAQKGLKALVPMLGRSFIVFLNDQEILEITGLDYELGSKLLIEKGAQTVVVTMGEKGCFIRTKKNYYRVPAYKTTVVDTTGAGDSFAAGFLYGLIKGCSMVDCGRMGNKMASVCIQKIGARTYLSEAGELVDFLNETEDID